MLLLCQPVAEAISASDIPCVPDESIIRIRAALSTAGTTYLDMSSSLDGLLEFRLTLYLHFHGFLYDTIFPIIDTVMSRLSPVKLIIYNNPDRGFVERNKGDFIFGQTGVQTAAVLLPPECRSGMPGIIAGTGYDFQFAILGAEFYVAKTCAACIGRRVSNAVLVAEFLLNFVVNLFQ